MLVFSSLRDAKSLLPGFVAVRPETNSPEAIRYLPRPSLSSKPPFLPARWCSPAPLPAPLRGLEDRIALALPNALIPRRNLSEIRQMSSPLVPDPTSFQLRTSGQLRNPPGDTA